MMQMHFSDNPYTTGHEVKVVAGYSFEMLE